MILSKIRNISKIGTQASFSIKKNGNIQLINNFSLLGISVLVFYMIVGQIYSTGLIAIEFTSLMALTIPIILNYYKKYDYAKSSIITVVILSIIAGNFLIGYDRNLKYAFIIPVALAYTFFYKNKNQKTYFLLIIIFISIFILELTHFIGLPQLKGVELAIAYYNTSYFIALMFAFVLLQSLSSKNIKQAEDKLKERLSYEKSITDFSETILKDRPNAINIGLQYILDASKASRIYIFENINSDDELCAKQTHEVCAPEISSQINNPSLHKFPYIKSGFSRWIKKLSKNELIQGIVDDFPECEKEALSAQKIKSILIIPIFTNRKWAGFIGFDVVNKARIWKEEDIRLLRTVSDIFGLYIESKQHQRLLAKRNEELMILNSTKDKFFSIIAHDLKSPFNALIGFADILVENIEDADYDDAGKFANIISSTSKNTFKLLENLLLWARSQTGEIKFNPTEINISSLIKENINIALPMALKKQITVHNLIPEQITLSIDREMINTIFRNLLANAIKFTREGGEIKLGYKKSDSKLLEFYIQDNGIGIPKENLSSLFNIEENYTTVGTHGETGSGLGLILCKEFIEKHNGSIYAESVREQGSTFFVRLPQGL